MNIFSRFALRIRKLLSDMENKKLISCRLRPDDIRRIDHFIERHEYWKRNTVISEALHTLLQNCTDQQLYDIVRWYEGTGCSVGIEIKTFRKDGITKGNPQQ